MKIGQYGPFPGSAPQIHGNPAGGIGITLDYHAGVAVFDSVKDDYLKFAYHLRFLDLSDLGTAGLPEKISQFPHGGPSVGNSVFLI